jgi:endonuclease III
MENDLESIAALLLKNRSGKEDWGDISLLNGANIFLLCCLLDWQMKADVAWRKGKELARKLGDLDDIWKTISSFSKDQWDSRYEEFGRPHRFHKGYTRLWAIANKICAWYDGDPRRIWADKSPAEVLTRLLELGAGDQISRMIIGALRDCDKIKGASSDVKADVHIRRVLGRAVYGEEIKASEAAKAIQLAKALNDADPWSLDWPLWNIGKSYCRPTNPSCESCYLNPHCDYYHRHGAGGTSGRSAI